MLLSGKKGLAAYLEEYGVRGSLPDIAGMYVGRRLVICGDAAGVWDDLDRFGCRNDAGRGIVAKFGHDFMVINRIGEVFPGAIEHWFSNHAGLIEIFKKARRQEYAQEFIPPVHTHSCTDGAMWKWPFGGHGTSAMGGALAGIGMGYEQIVLCGIPLDNGPHNGEPPWRKTNFSAEVPQGDKHWKRFAQFFGGQVFSMSGRTKEWLGEP